MLPGQRGAQALAEGIFGEMNAWGRLPFTIYPESFAKDAPMTEVHGHPTKHMLQPVTMALITSGFDAMRYLMIKWP